MKHFLFLVLAAGGWLLAPACARAKADLAVVLTSKETAGSLMVTGLVKNLGPQDYKKSQGRTVTLSSGKTVFVKKSIPDLQKDQIFSFTYKFASKPASLPLYAEITPRDDNPKNDEFGLKIKTDAGKSADLSAFAIRLGDPVDGSVRLTAVVKNVDNKITYQKSLGRKARVTAPALGLDKTFPLPRNLPPGGVYPIDAGTFPAKKLPPQLLVTLTIDRGDRNPANDILSKTLITPTYQADLMAASLQTRGGKTIVGVVKNRGPVAYRATQGRTVTLAGGAAPRTVKIPNLRVGEEFPVEVDLAANAGPTVQASLSISPGDKNARNDWLTLRIKLGSGSPAPGKGADLAVAALTMNPATKTLTYTIVNKGPGDYKGGRSYQITATGLGDPLRQTKIPPLAAGARRDFVLDVGARLASLKPGTRTTITLRILGDDDKPGNTQRETVYTVPAGPSPRTFDLTVVAKINQKPVQGAEVAVKREGETVASGTTDFAGRRTFTGLRAGEYTVQVSKKGANVSGVRVTVNLTKTDILGIDLTPGTSLPPKSLDLTIIAKTSTGAPVIGAAVTVRRRGVVVSGKTLSSGRYLARGLAPGEYEILVGKEGFKVPEPQQVTLRARDDTLVFVLIPDKQKPLPPKLYDLTIVARTPRNTRLTGVDVIVKEGTRTVASGTTGVYGYTARLGAGNYTVSLTRRGYQPASTVVIVSTRDVSRDITLTPDTTPAPKSLELTIIAKTATGSPVIGAAVRVQTRGEKLVASGTTRASGRYVATGLAPGDYFVFVEMKGVRDTGPRRVTLARNDTLRFVLSPDRRERLPPKPLELTIIAKTSTGAPVIGAAVRVQTRGEKPVASGRTRASGRYVATGLAPGDYFVLVEMRGFRAGRTHQTPPELLQRA